MTTSRTDIDHAAARIEALADDARHRVDTGRRPLDVIGSLLHDLATLAADMRTPGRLAWCPLCATDAITPTDPTA